MSETIINYFIACGFIMQTFNTQHDFLVEKGEHTEKFFPFVSSMMISKTSFVKFDLMFYKKLKIIFFFVVMLLIQNQKIKRIIYTHQLQHSTVEYQMFYIYLGKQIEIMNVTVNFTHFKTLDQTLHVPFFEIKAQLSRI